MVAFSERPLCYQVGMLLLLLATSVFAAGVALPWWAQTHAKGTEVIISHTGLWLGCSSTQPGEPDNCSTIDAPNWFKAVQALQCLSLAGMLVASAYAIFTNCCLDHATFSRTLEIAAGAGGVLGVVSTMLYVAKTSHILRKSKDASYSWAFAMDVSACVFVTFIAAIIALTNSRHTDDMTSQFILEEGSSYYYRSPHTKSGSRRMSGKQRGWEMEMTPVRTPTVPTTPRRGAEVIVLQNNYCADSPRLAVSGSLGHDEAARVICPGHDHRCRPQCAFPPEYSSDCSAAFQSSCTKHPVGPPPLRGLRSSASCPEPKQFTSCLQPPPPPPPPRCACPRVNSVSPHPQSHYSQRGTVDFINETSSTGIDKGLDSHPRAVASAPPLSLQSEEGDPLDFTAAHYFNSPQTICVGEGPKREQ